MTTVAARFEPIPEAEHACWALKHGDARLGVVERSPAGNFYAFVHQRCLGLFGDRVEAGEAIAHQHGLQVEVIL